MPEVTPLPTQGNCPRNLSIISLLTDKSQVHDDQLAYYAKVIENTFRDKSSESPEELAISISNTEEDKCKKEIDLKSSFSQSFPNIELENID